MANTTANANALSTEAKTAEFARLFALFERLAAYPSQTTTLQATAQEATEEEQEDPAIPIPTDLAPVFNNLAAVLSTRSRPAHSPLSHSHSAMRGIRTHDHTGSLINTFPLRKQFPFTFRLMIHKLYAMDEWAEKVKEVVERSRRQFKPLGEQEREQRGRGRECVAEVGGEGEVLSPTSLISQARVPGHANGNLTRLRSHTITGAGSPTAMSPQAKSNFSATIREDVRAIKKRCIGRRRSMGGIVGDGGPRTGEAGRWTYNAKVSSVEVVLPPRRAGGLCSSAEGQSGAGKKDTEVPPPDTAHSLGGARSARAREAARARLRIEVGGPVTSPYPCKTAMAGATSPSSWQLYISKSSARSETPRRIVKRRARSLLGGEGNQTFP